jgi:hypothetical protein
MARKPNPRNAKHEIDKKLDEALKDSFPASDPVALIQPAPKRPQDKPAVKARRKTG